ncbi:hypothetical protein JCM10207_000973 [Rhodosporidiobolus poonsookiae]
MPHRRSHSDTPPHPDDSSSVRKKHSRLAHLLGWTERVAQEGEGDGDSRSSTHSTLSTTGESFEVRGGHFDHHRTRNTEAKRDSDHSVASAPKHTRPPLPKAHTWSSNPLRPTRPPNPEHRTAPAAAPHPAASPSTSNLTPSSRARPFPTLRNMPSRSRFSFTSRTSQPSSPLSPFSLVAREPSSPTVIHEQGQGSTPSPRRGTSTAGGGTGFPFFPPYVSGSTPPIARFDPLRPPPSSHSSRLSPAHSQSQGSTTPTTRYDPGEPPSYAVSGLPLVGHPYQLSPQRGRFVEALDPALPADDADFAVEEPSLAPASPFSPYPSSSTHAYSASAQCCSASPPPSPSPRSSVPTQSGSSTPMSELAAQSFALRCGVELGTAYRDEGESDLDSEATDDEDESDDDDDEDDDLVSLAPTFPPPGLSSRFSDWTPTPPESELELGEPSDFLGVGAAGADEAQGVVVVVELDEVGAGEGVRIAFEWVGEHPRPGTGKRERATYPPTTLPRKQAISQPTALAAQRRWERQGGTQAWWAASASAPVSERGGRVAVGG